MKHALKQALKPAFHTYQKYFSEVGYITREVNLKLSQTLHAKEISQRRALASAVRLSSPFSEMCRDLENNGAVIAKLEQFSPNASTLLDGLRTQAEAFGNPTMAEISNQRLGKSKKYWFDIFAPEHPDSAALQSFVVSAPVLDLAAAYMGCVPELQDINYYYSPAETKPSGALLGSQGWHYDNDKTKRLKLFISPFALSAANGATMYFPKSAVTFTHYPYHPNYFDDTQAQALGLRLEDIKTMQTQVGEFMLADTSNIIHCGARNQRAPRFVVIVTFAAIEGYLNPFKAMPKPAFVEPLNRQIMSYFNTRRTL